MKPCIIFLFAVAFFVQSCQDSSSMQASIKEDKTLKETPPSKVESLLTKLLKDENWQTFLIEDSLFQAKKHVVNFYERSLKPVWTNDVGLTEHGESLMQMVQNSEGYGLDSSLFNEQNISVFLKGSLDDVIKAELLMTDQYYRLATYFKFGYIAQDSYEPIFWIDSIKEDLAKHLADGIENDRMKESLFFFEPKLPEYKNLRAALETYTQEFPLSDDKRRVLSMKDDSLKSFSQCKEALVMYGYLDTLSAQNDSLLIEAIKLFQTHNGLHSDGRPGKYTAREMSKSNLYRYEKAKAALTKLRWNKYENRSDYLYANIPSFTMKVSEGGKYVRTHNSVIGKSWTRTPELHAELEYFILNPRWHVPKSISSTELLEKAKKDPTYLNRNGYRVSQGGKTVKSDEVKWGDVSSSSFNYKISQNSGRGNALGKVKFIFPNGHNVYFHDTPSRYLFKNDMRAYSHGCVRIQDPLELAKYLATKQNLSIEADSVEAKVATRVNRKITLEKKLDVFIEYYVAGTNQEGVIQFYPDIYKKDKNLIDVVAGRKELVEL